MKLWPARATSKVPTQFTIYRATNTIIAIYRAIILSRLMPRETAWPRDLAMAVINEWNCYQNGHFPWTQSGKVKNLVLDPSISLDLGVISLLTMTSTLSSRENIFMKSNLQSAIWQNISWIQFCSRSSGFKKNILTTSCQIKECWLYQVIRWRHITESIHFNWCS